MALVSAGAEVNEPDQIGCTPLHYAAASQAFSRFADTRQNAVGEIRLTKGGMNRWFRFSASARVDRHFSGNRDNNEEEAKESYL